MKRKNRGENFKKLQTLLLSQDAIVQGIMGQPEMSDEAYYAMLDEQKRELEMRQGLQLQPSEEGQMTMSRAQGSLQDYQPQFPRKES